MIMQLPRRRLRAQPEHEREAMKYSVFRYLMIAPLLVALDWPLTAAAAPKLVSYAQVRPDATLLVGSKVVRLYGIYVPPSEYTCRSCIRPVKCGSNAVLALDFKIRGFVHCEPVTRHRDRSITALCRNRGVDLGAYLIERGWAVALPNGPFQYHVLEEIARDKNMGVWGFRGTPLPFPHATR